MQQMEVKRLQMRTKKAPTGVGAEMRKLDGELQGPEITFDARQITLSNLDVRFPRERQPARFDTEQGMRLHQPPKPHRESHAGPG